MKIDNFFSSCQILLSGVPQSSMMGPVLLIDFLMIYSRKPHLYNFADDNTICRSTDDFERTQGENTFLTEHFRVTASVYP